MKALIFDTETTGVTLKNTPLNHPDQPFIVTLSAILTDDSREEISTMDFIIKPKGWSVPNSAAEVHGIPTEKAEEFGIPIELALNIFVEMANKADYIVGHNVNFDINMLRRYSQTPNKIFLDDSDRFIIFDTMEACRNVVKLEATDKMKAARARGYNVPEFKNPQLQEAHQFFFGEQFDGAHDSLNDVRATMRVFFEEIDLKLQRDGILV